MLDVIVRALSLILIIVIGFTIKRIGWVSKNDFGIFSNIVLKITLPCSVITSFNVVDIETSMIVYVIIAIFCNLILGGVGFLVGRKDGKDQQAFNIINYGSYNIGAFTIPYISSFIGPAGVVIVSIFDVGNSISAAGINYSLSKSLADKSQKLSLKGILVNMFSSILFMTYLSMFLVRLLNITLPAQIITFTSIVGSANTFLAMLMIGIAFEINLDPSKVHKSLKGLGIRYMVSVIMALIVYFILPLPAVGKGIIAVVLFSPIAAMATGFTKEIKGDLESASFMSSMSIVIGIVVMTILLSI